jgi:hypothetical protein
MAPPFTSRSSTLTFVSRYALTIGTALRCCVIQHHRERVVTGISAVRCCVHSTHQ